MKRLERRQELIAALGQDALLTSDLDSILTSACVALREALELPIVAIAELQGAGPMRLRGSIGLSEAYGVEIAPLVAGSPVQRALQARTSFVSEDHLANAVPLPPALQAAGARSGLMVPMLALDRPRGFIGVHDIVPRRFQRAEIGFAQSVANIVAAVLVRREMEERADDDRHRLNAVLDHAGNGIYLRDREGRYVLVNRAFARVVGREPEAIVGLTPEELFGAGAAAELRAGDQRVLESGEPLEVEDRTGDGDQARTFLSIKFPWHGRGGEVEGVGGVSIEITQRVRAERDRERLRARLRRSERMEAVGQLAGGIAHDFNNLLGVILNYSEFVATELAPESQGTKDLERIREAARRAADLTQSLLVFTDERTGQPERLLVRDVVQDVQHLLERTLGRHIELTTHLSDRPTPVRMARSDLEDMLVSLVTNARDAMPDGGRVELIVQDAEHNGVPAVRLSIRDTGTGMTPEVAARAVEPYFTTKPTGRGTGLGLATVYGVVRSAGGALDIESQPGLGTTVHVSLPAAGAAVRDAPEDVPRPTGAGWVLVVEDELAVLDVIRRILTGAGYGVLTAAGVQDALAQASRERFELALVVTDVMLGDGSGPELVERLRRERPDLRAVFCSGYADDHLERHQAVLQGSSFLRKPFTSGQMLEAVRRELQSTAFRSVGSR